MQYLAIAPRGFLAATLALMTLGVAMPTGSAQTPTTAAQLRRYQQYAANTQKRG